MITSFLIIAIALTWLGWETNWLTVRLPIGSIPELPELKRITWGQIVGSLCGRRDKDKPNFVRLPRYYEPLCGWEWLRTTLHVVPETHVEMELGNVRYNMTIRDPGIIKGIMRANHLTRKEKLAYTT